LTHCQILGIHARNNGGFTGTIHEIMEVLMGRVDIYIYPLVNSLVDPENKHFLVDTNLPSAMNGRVVMLIYWRV